MAKGVKKICCVFTFHKMNSYNKRTTGLKGHLRVNCTCLTCVCVLWWPSRIYRVYGWGSQPFSRYKVDTWKSRVNSRHHKLSGFWANVSERVSCGDIYCPYTYCRRCQFMPLRSAHCRPKAYIVAGMNFLPWYIVVGNNMCQSVPHIVSPHSVQHSKKIFG